MSCKHCGSHCHSHCLCHCKLHKLCCCHFVGFLAFIFIVLFIFLVIWLVLRPTNPRFYLQDATLDHFNLTEPYLLSTIMQVTVSTRNPNDRIGIYYDKLDIYAEYRDQQITVATVLPSGYQGHNDVIVWSPYLFGPDAPIAPYLAVALSQDESAGFLLLYVRIDGKLRWKVGTWISGHYNIHVHCPAFLTVNNGSSNAGSPYCQFQKIAACSVDAYI